MSNISASLLENCSDADTDYSPFEFFDRKVYWLYIFSKRNSCFIFASII